MVGIGAPGSDTATGAICAALYSPISARAYPITTDAVLALSPSMITCTTTGCRNARRRANPEGIVRTVRARPSSMSRSISRSEST